MLDVYRQAKLSTLAPQLRQASGELVQLPSPQTVVR